MGPEGDRHASGEKNIPFKTTMITLMGGIAMIACDSE
jgi:hypothetical protein